MPSNCHVFTGVQGQIPTIAELATQVKVSRRCNFILRSVLSHYIYCGVLVFHNGLNDLNDFNSFVQLF